MTQCSSRSFNWFKCLEQWGQTQRHAKHDDLINLLIRRRRIHEKLLRPWKNISRNFDQFMFLSSSDYEKQFFGMLASACLCMCVCLYEDTGLRMSSSKAHKRSGGFHSYSVFRSLFTLPRSGFGRPEHYSSMDYKTHNGKFLEKGWNESH